MTTNAPFPIQPELTEIAIAYRNNKMIADDILPRVTVGKKEYKYQKYPIGEAFTLPNVLAHRRNAPTEVEWTGTETLGNCKDYALDDAMPADDINNAPDGVDVVGRSVEWLANLMDLAREKRVADLVQATGNYAAANKTTLAGANQWSDITSDPIKDIMVGLDACILRPNIGWFGRATWSKLIQHPNIIKATQKNAGDRGIAQRQAIADLFELEAIFVGEGWINTAKKGATVSLARVWGKKAGFIYRDSLADASRGVTFGFTAQYGTKEAGSEEDSKIGPRGGVRARVIDSVDEVITANDLGYLIIDAVA